MDGAALIDRISRTDCEKSVEERVDNSIRITLTLDKVGASKVRYVALRIQEIRELCVKQGAVSFESLLSTHTSILHVSRYCYLGCCVTAQNSMGSSIHSVGG